MDKKVVQIGSKVGLIFLNFGEEDVYILTENNTVDSFKNEISVNSPIGIAILGKKEGESVTYKVSSNVNHVKIVKIY